MVEGTLAASLLPATLAGQLAAPPDRRSGRRTGSSSRRGPPTASSRASRRPGHDLLAVQWHPELLAKPDPTFEWIVGAAAKSQRLSLAPGRRCLTTVV